MAEFKWEFGETLSLQRRIKQIDDVAVLRSLEALIKQKIKWLEEQQQNETIRYELLLRDGSWYAAGPLRSDGKRKAIRLGEQLSPAAALKIREKDPRAAVLRLDRKGMKRIHQLEADGHEVILP